MKLITPLGKLPGQVLRVDVSLFVCVLRFEERNPGVGDSYQKGYLPRKLSAKLRLPVFKDELPSVARSGEPPSPLLFHMPNQRDPRTQKSRTSAQLSAGI